MSELRGKPGLLLSRPEPCTSRGARTMSRWPTHFKEFTKKGTDYSLETFRPLLDGTTNWPAVVEALDQTGYRGFCTFE